MSFPFHTCRVENLSTAFNLPLSVDVLRLDVLHPIVSGNKWFKLKKYLEEARQKNKTTLLTFGGAYSNHIVATAAAAQIKGFRSVGIIRGEEPPALSHTLQEAINCGMKLYFVSRDAYKLKLVPAELKNEYQAEELYTIPEGGYGEKGMQGAKEILQQINTNRYTHFICAVGTGTTIAGIANAALPNQKTIGISALKNNFSLQNEIEKLLPNEKRPLFDLLFDYHFGGYAKYTKPLLEFMNELYSKTNIPTDFVYTGKMFYAAIDLVNKGFFKASDKILLIHTGGLQGNHSLPKGTLIFQ